MGYFCFCSLYISKLVKRPSELVLAGFVPQPHWLSREDFVVLLLALSLRPSAFLEHFQGIFHLVLEDVVVVVMRGDAGLIGAHVQELLGSG